uniref:RNA-directed RNA polymerase n=1 Tax=Bursaphelenchus xylophilus TaxID=6326 RepID=A0A1I7RUN6_BURXY
MEKAILIFFLNFRRIKAIDNELETTIDEQVNSSVQLDPTIFVEGYNEPQYMEIAKDHFRKYVASMEHQLLQRFGVDTEVELFSNSYSAIRKRISDKEMDDMSFFNTQRVIEETLEQIYSSHRRMFFEAFGQKFEDLTETKFENETREVSDKRHVLRDQCRNPPEELKKLAVAYYYTAYDAGHQRFLSFAWLCADVIARVRLDYITELRRQNPNQEIYYYSFDPVSDRLSTHIDDYLNSKSSRRGALARFLEANIKKYRTKEATKLIFKYCEVYDGLMDLMTFTVKWAEKNGILVGTGERKERDLMDVEQVGVPVFNSIHMCLMIILFGQGKLDTINTPRSFEEPEDLEGMDPVDLRKQHGGLGQRFLGLMRFMASRDFLMLKELSFLDFGYVSGFYNNEWFYAQKAAEKTYYKICLTNDYSAIPYDKDKQKVTDIVEKVDIEGRVASDGISFLVELLKGTANQVMNKKNVRALEDHSGCESIFWRQDFANSDDCLTDRIYVTAVGTVTAVNRLRRYLTPKGYLNSRMSDLSMGKSFASQVMNKIYQLTRKEEKVELIEEKVEEDTPVRAAPRIKAYTDENGHIVVTKPGTSKD